MDPVSSVVPDSKYIDRKRIACATCGTSLSAKIKEPNAVFTHPLLDTLQCKVCHVRTGPANDAFDFVLDLLRKLTSDHLQTIIFLLQKCHEFYGDGDFSMDEDGSDKYCRMCGNGGELYICGKPLCPFGFCQVRIAFGLSFTLEYE